ncbi:DNA oxidative demethylase ALKBH2 [Trichonephila clavata]|uniref:DNA oxidative demethylase ALKBH2 n=1 Tax=Trichonephila clavata TaxID=2740835 RepID=A0A8X6JJP2_TRICU|nr:DNA oxidative demethylase ALKBH2 [Trichonephila clavata]
MQSYLIRKAPTESNTCQVKRIKHTFVPPKTENNLNFHPCSSKTFVEDKNNKSTDKADLTIVNFEWKIITDSGLNLKYAKIFSNTTSKYVFERLENEVEYFSGDLLKVCVYGSWHDIPRKQVSFGDEGLSYKFSGTCLPSKPWKNCPIVLDLKECVESVTGESFNFVLINRYKDGEDHMGEHRDDEKELVPTAPIASLSFGQARDFIFRHKDTKKKNSNVNIPRKTINLESGSLLLMEYPTNKFWYHSLPKRKGALGVRINLTFRKMVLKRK